MSRALGRAVAIASALLAAAVELSQDGVADQTVVKMSDKCPHRLPVWWWGLNH